MGERDRQGMVLVLVTGILMLLLLAGTALLQTVHAASAGLGAALSACRASLAAESGMDYAAARLLSETGVPRFSRTGADRGDDWSFREGETASLDGARNPSYSHGEPWLDDPAAGGDGLDNDDDGLTDEPGEGLGRAEPAERPTLDRNGDGRLSAWTGRIRGGGAGAVFSLRIGSVGSRLPVNGGSLLPGSANDIVGSYYHRGLALALNNLGAILIQPGGTRRFRVATCGVPVETSWLGNDLLSRRPVGGYRSMKEARESLLASGYAAAEIERVLPYLDAGPYEVQAESGNISNDDSGRTVPYPQVELRTAPPRVLESLWRYLRTRAGAIPAEAGAWTRVSPWTGLRFDRTGTPPVPPSTTQDPLMTLVIHPEEARGIARVAAALRERETDGVSWEELHQELADWAPALFAADVSDLSAYPIARKSWARAKADLAFLSMTMERSPAVCPAILCSRGIDHDPEEIDPSRLVPQPFSVIDPYFLNRVPQPSLAEAQAGAYPVPSDPWRWVKQSGPPGPPQPDITSRNRVRPQGLTLAPAARFRVECAARCGKAGWGGAARLSGQVRASERLELTSQEDFENVKGGAALSLWRGIEAIDPLPPARRPVAADLETGRDYPLVASLPRWSLRGVLFPIPAAHQPCSRFYGSLTLSPRETGRGGAGLYWPVSEDYDPADPSDFSEEPACLYPLAPSIPSQDGDGIASWSLNMLGPVSCDLPKEVQVQPFYTLIDRMTIEAWAGPIQIDSFFGASRTILQIQPVLFRVLGVDYPAGGGHIKLTAIRDVQSGRAGTRFRLYVKWPNGDPGPMGGLAYIPTSFMVNADLILDSFVADHDPATGKVQSGMYHLILEMENLRGSVSPNKTRFTLYVNGEPAPGYPTGALHPKTGERGDMLLSLPNPPASPLPDRLELHHLDEIRVYGGLAAGSASLHFKKGRFVPPPDDPVNHPVPSYTSPRYDLGDSRSRLLLAEWSGLTSSVVKKQADINVFLDAWDAAGDQVWSRLPLFASGRVHELPADEIRSFRYTVVFFDPKPNDLSNNASPLLDSPVFESIWFSLRRPSRLPEWTGWTR